MGDKQNDVKTKQVKHENTYTNTMYVQIHDTHMYTHILTK